MARWGWTLSLGLEECSLDAMTWIWLQQMVTRMGTWWKATFSGCAEEPFCERPHFRWAPPRGAMTRRSRWGGCRAGLAFWADTLAPRTHFRQREVFDEAKLVGVGPAWGARRTILQLRTFQVEPASCPCRSRRMLAKFQSWTQNRSGFQRLRRGRHHSDQILAARRYIDHPSWRLRYCYSPHKSWACRQRRNHSIQSIFHLLS